MDEGQGIPSPEMCENWHLQIFNSSFGPSEGEEADRIVFYHPSTDSDELKCKSVGFAEASVRFADAFFTDDDDDNGSEGNLRSCHTQVSFLTKSMFQIQGDPSGCS